MKSLLMTFSIVFCILISTIIISKVRDIIRRNALDIRNQRGLLITSGLAILFLITNLTMPYPQSLYWFIMLGIIFTGSILSFKIMKKEYGRLRHMQPKAICVNVLFYTLLFVVTSIYI